MADVSSTTTDRRTAQSGLHTALGAILVLERRGFHMRVDRTPARIATDDGAWTDVVQTEWTLTHDDGTEIVVRTVEAAS